ncbi:MAG: AAA family ATPase [Sphingobacteriales bacterium]|nr:AAA family ATPase [Sphingobacteriales bacterium]
MKKWIFTGISGSGRVELVEEIKGILLNKGVTVRTYDLGSMIREVCHQNKIEFDDEKILDMDGRTLKLARALALQQLDTEILKDNQTELHLIGVHLTFKWKGRLIPGFTLKEISSLDPDGFINVVDNVEDMFNSITKNPKWQKVPRPDLEEIQYWLMEEEFITKMLGELTNKPVYILARKHNIDNASDLFLTTKKKIYLSYPITAIRDSNPEVLNQIQGEYLAKLQENFIVFNPLSIEDMKLTYPQKNDESWKYPELLDKINSDVIEIIKTRTIHRDYQFIDQSDGVVVFYITDKLSPGVMGEMYYAHRNQKPVFVVFKGSRSPFLSDISYIIENNPEDLFKHLQTFANK